MPLTGTVRTQPHEPRKSAVGTVPGAVADRAGVLLVVGGLLWVTTYVVEILIGVLLGEATYVAADPSSSWLVWLWPATFMAAVLGLAAGVIGVACRVGRRGRVVAVLGAALAVVALTAAAVNLVRLTGVTGEVTASDDLGFLGVVGVLGGSILVGAAGLRGRAVPRRAGWTLALLPLAFVPAILATFPLASVAPEYVVADLPFPVVGLVLAAVGVALHRVRTPRGS
jgi:hypothetical protein